MEVDVSGIARKGKKRLLSYRFLENSSAESDNL